MTSEGGVDAGSAEGLVRDVAVRLTWVGWIANAVGAAVVFAAIGFLVPIFLDASERSDLAVLNGPLVAGYLLTGGLVGATILARHRTKVLRWIGEERPPTEREHELTLAMPLRGAIVALAGWAIGVVLFFAVNLNQSLGFAAVVGATVALGGETTCALIYLMSERVLRPVTARALMTRVPAQPVGLGVRARLLFAWSLGTAVPLLGVVVVGIIGATKSDVDVQYVAAAAIFIGAVALTAGLLATLFAAHAIADPVTAVRAALERVESGDLEARVEVDDGSEVGLMQAGFNRMAEGLREREQIRDLFGRQVGRDVARAALRDGTRLGGEQREIGALFVDMTGSTSMAIALPPEEVVRLLNVFFQIVVEEVEAQSGLVNKFEGDAAMCVFGAPVPRDDPSGDALRAARRLVERLDREVAEVDYGIGVASGPAVAGNVGAEQRFEYTVIGDPVNQAARLCELAKERGERLLASGRAVERARDAERSAWSLSGSALLRGRDEPTPLALPRAAARV